MAVRGTQCPEPVCVLFISEEHHILKSIPTQTPHHFDHTECDLTSQPNIKQQLWTAVEFDCML